MVEQCGGFADGYSGDDFGRRVAFVICFDQNNHSSTRLMPRRSHQPPRPLPPSKSAAVVSPGRGSARGASASVRHSPVTTRTPVQPPRRRRHAPCASGAVGGDRAAGSKLRAPIAEQPTLRPASPDGAVDSAQSGAQPGERRQILGADETLTLSVWCRPSRSIVRRRWPWSTQSQCGRPKPCVATRCAVPAPLTPAPP